MNGTEQQTASTRYGQLSQQIADAADLVEALDQKIMTLAGIVKDLDRRQATHASAVGQLQIETRAIWTAANRHEVLLMQWLTRSFWQRLRWIVVGR